MKTSYSLVKLLPIALLLSACVSKTPHTSMERSSDSPQWRQQQAQLKQINHFETRGAFAFLGDQQKVYARFNWQQQSNNRYRLLLTSPLGSTELQLDQQGNTVQIVDNKGQRYQGNDAQQLVYQLTGMQIPLQNLRQWMLGLPGSADHYSLNGNYQLQTADYQANGINWHLSISEYRNDVQPPLPASLELKTVGQRIKLRMDSWIIK